MKAFKLFYRSTALLLFTVMLTFPGITTKAGTPPILKNSLPKAHNHTLAGQVAEDFVISTLPYRQSFDENRDLPPGWLTLTNSVASERISVVNRNYMSAPNSLVMNNIYDVVNALAILPRIDQNIDIQDLELTFYARISPVSEIDTFQVGVMTDPTDSLTFVPIKILEKTVDYQLQTVSFENYIGEGQYIAIRWKTLTRSSAYIDDVTLRLATPCSPPGQIQIEQVSGTSASISWGASTGNVQDYFYEYAPLGTENWASGYSEENAAILSGLTEKTYYIVNVSAICDEIPDTVSRIFFTTCNTFDDLQVGNGNSLSGEIPFYTSFPYSYSQQIFTVEDLGNAAREIEFIGFQFNTSTFELNRALNIYLGYTEDHTTTNWIPKEQLQHVFAGNANFHNQNEDGWVYLLLDQPFSYDGLKNLVMVVYDTTGQTSTTSQFYTHTSSTQSLIRGQGSPINNLTPPAESEIQPIRNNVRFASCSEIGCLAPNHLRVTNITGEEALITWVEDGIADLYRVEYQAGENGPWIFYEETSDEYVSFTALTPQTSYTVRVKTICSEGDSSAWNEISFTTLCRTFELPYVQYFDQTASRTLPECWTGYTTLASNTPFVEQPAGGNYISAPGILNFNTTTGGSNLAILPRIDFDGNYNDLLISFWAKSTPGNTGELSIGIMDNPNDPATFTTVNNISFTDHSQWIEFYLVIPEYSGSGDYIAFRSYNALPFYMDDLVVELTPSCMKPTDIYVDTVTATSARIQWTDNNGDIEWIIRYRPVNGAEFTFDTVDTHPHDITGLTPNQSYEFWISAFCSDEDTSRWSHRLTFTTACRPLSRDAIPYYQNFDHIEDLADLPICWTRLTDNTGFSQTFPRLENAYTHTPPRSLMFRSEPGHYSMIVLEEFDESIRIDSLVISFMRYPRFISTILVGVMTDPNDESTFTELNSTVTIERGWNSEELSLSGYQNGQGRYIAIKTGGPDDYVAIDDIRIDFVSDCARPANLRAHDINFVDASVSWDPQGTDTEWVVQIRQSGYLAWESTVVTGTPTHHFEDLEAGLSYDVRVRAICGEEDSSSYTQIIKFITSCAPPARFEIVDITDHEVFVSWSRNYPSERWIIGVKRTGIGMSYAYSDTISDRTTFSVDTLVPGLSYDITIFTICNRYGGTEESTLNFTTETEPRPEFLTIRAASGPNGSIIPGGEIRVPYGTDTTFKFRPNDGYLIRSVIVDNQAQPLDTFYTFRNVTSDHTIRVDFVTTGITENDMDNRIRIYPNPVSQMLYIEHDIPFEQIKITTLPGQILYRNTVSGNRTEIDVAAYPPGIYFITLEGRDGHVTKKIIKK